MDQKSVIRVIMDCRLTLGFKQYVILTKQQSVMTKIMSHLEYKHAEIIRFRLQHWLMTYDYKIAIEMDENEPIKRNTDYKIKTKSDTF